MLTYFIADLHLSDDEPHLQRLLTTFLTQQLQAGDHLYLLGDLFALWIGFDDPSPINLQVIDALAALKARAIHVSLLVGNRDFLINTSFAKAANVTLLPEKHVIDVHGEPWLLLHGDTLCTLDVRYQAFRKRTQQKWLQWLFLHLPLCLRVSIAAHLRGQSRVARPNSDRAMMDVVDSAVLRDCQDYGVKGMIHGHTHQPGIHYYQLAQEQSLCRYTLSDWGSSGNYLVIDEAGHKKLEYFQ